MPCISQTLDHSINSSIGHLLIVNILAVDIVLGNFVPCRLNEIGIGSGLVALVKKRIAIKLLAEPANPEGKNNEGSNDEKLFKDPLEARVLI